MKLRFLGWWAAGVCLVVGTAAAAEPAKPRVLILGDSISLGYTPHVRDALKADAVVIRPKENCEGTTAGVKKIDAWLALDGGRWDVIHFNFGLHDLKHVDPQTGKNSDDPNQPQQADVAQYEKNLREIVGKLKRTGARLIFATTTPVPPGGVKPFRDINDPAKYNAAARKVMEENGVAVNDLYGFCEPRLKEIQKPVDVHFTEPGSKALAAEVVRQIRRAVEQAEVARPKAAGE